MDVMLINREILLKALLLSNLVAIPILGENYSNIYNKRFLDKIKFKNVISYISFSEKIDGYNFEKSSFVHIDNKNEKVTIKTVRDGDTIKYDGNKGMSYIIYHNKRIKIDMNVSHWSVSMMTPKKGRIIGIERLYNLDCYHIYSESMDVWVDTDKYLPIMVIYKGEIEVKIIIKRYVKLIKDIHFPTHLVIYIDNQYYSTNVIEDISYKGG